MNLRWLKPVPLLIVLSVAAVITTLRVLSLPQVLPNFHFLQPVENQTYDWRMKALFARQTPVATNLAAIFIDDESLKILNQTYGFTWPLPRQVYGKLVRELNAQGAKAIGFDILFAEQHPRFTNTDVRLPDGRVVGSDEFFAQQIQAARGKVILGVMGESIKDRHSGRVWWNPFLPAPLFTNGAHLAHVIGIKDFDGTMRRSAAFLEDGRTNGLGRLWGLSMILAATDLGLDLNRAQVVGGKLILEGAGGARRVIPVDQEHAFLINWAMPWNDQRMGRHSIEEVLLMDELRQSGQATNEPVFKDKLVVIGSIGTGNNLSDIGATAVDKETYYVSKHWNVTSSILTNRLITACPLWLEIALIALMTVLGSLLTYATRAWLSSVCVVGCIAVYISLAYWLFVDHLFWLPIITPCIAAMLSCHFATMTYRVVIEQREQRRIKGIFSKVVAPDIVNELLQAERLALGGAQRRVTVFFADVRGFTDLTDTTQSRAEEYARQHQLAPEAARDYFDAQARELLATVNLYLSTVAGIIKNHGGTLDKYIGDCVMAFWGAPTPNEKHAVACVRAAISVQQTIARLNQQRELENQRRVQENAQRAAANLPQLPLLSQLYLGSGINTGIVTVGLMGSEEHLFNYTVFGREVNLASRLEGISGRGRIIIGEATYEDLKRDDPGLASACVPLEPVNVKGFRKLVQIYEVPWRLPEPPAQSAPGSP